MLEDLKAIVGYALAAALVLALAALIWGGDNDADGATDDARRTAATLERIERHLQDISWGTCRNEVICGE